MASYHRRAANIPASGTKRNLQKERYTTELALALEQRLGIQSPVMMLNESPTTEKVARRIVERLLSGGDEENDDAILNAAKQYSESASAEELQKIADDVRVLKQAGARLMG